MSVASQREYRAKRWSNPAMAAIKTTNEGEDFHMDNKATAMTTAAKSETSSTVDIQTGVENCKKQANDCRIHSAECRSNPSVPAARPNRAGQHPAGGRTARRRRQSLSGHPSSHLDSSRPDRSHFPGNSSQGKHGPRDCLCRTIPGEKCIGGYQPVEALTRLCIGSTTSLP